VIPGATCACRKSSSHIQMMKSAKKRRRQNATNGMYCSRRAFAKLRNPNFAGVARVRSLERDGFERGPTGDRGQGLAGSTRARASARARQPDAARHAAIHAGRAADRNGALFGSRHLARPWRERLGNGEGEFPLVEAPSSCGGAMPRCGTPNRFAAQHECGQASLSWAGRDWSNRGSRRLCP
jgi:hypothetical protein